MRGCVRVELHATHLNLRQTTVDTTPRRKPQEERRSGEQNAPGVLSPHCSVAGRTALSEPGRRTVGRSVPRNDGGVNDRSDRSRTAHRSKGIVDRREGRPGESTDTKGCRPCAAPEMEGSNRSSENVYIDGSESGRASFRLESRRRASAVRRSPARRLRRPFHVPVAVRVRAFARTRRRCVREESRSSSPTATARSERRLHRKGPRRRKSASTKDSGGRW